MKEEKVMTVRFEVLWNGGPSLKEHSCYFCSSASHDACIPPGRLRLVTNLPLLPLMDLTRCHWMAASCSCGRLTRKTPKQLDPEMWYYRQPRMQNISKDSDSQPAESPSRLGLSSGGGEPAQQTESQTCQPFPCGTTCCDFMILPSLLAFPGELGKGHFCSQ